MLYTACVRSVHSPSVLKACLASKSPDPVCLHDDEADAHDVHPHPLFMVMMFPSSMKTAVGVTTTALLLSLALHGYFCFISSSSFACPLLSFRPSCVSPCNRSGVRSWVQINMRSRSHALMSRKMMMKRERHLFP